METLLRSTSVTLRHGLQWMVGVQTAAGPALMMGAHQSSSNKRCTRFSAVSSDLGSFHEALHVRLRHTTVDNQERNAGKSVKVSADDSVSLRPLQRDCCDKHGPGGSVHLLNTRTIMLGCSCFPFKGFLYTVFKPELH